MPDDILWKVIFNKDFKQTEGGMENNFETKTIGSVRVKTLLNEYFDDEESLCDKIQNLNTIGGIKKV